MASVNKAILVGHCGQDPVLRYLPNGDAVANITVATSEQWKDKEGNKHDKAEWHRVVMFKKLAEIAGEYLKKGSQVYIEGRLETKKWTDKAGVDRYTTEIIADKMQMLSKAERGNERPAETSDGGKEPKTGFDDMDSDIPF